MRLYEDYLTLRSHYNHVSDGQEIQVTMEKLSNLLFCTTRNAKLILIKMMDKKWLLFKPGVGRGRKSTLTFHYSIHEILKKATEDMISNGNLEGMVHLIKKYGNDRAFKEYFQDFISNYFGFSLERYNYKFIETLRLPIFRTINTLIPSEAFYALDIHMVKQIYNTLVEFDNRNNEIIPSIAHFWESNHNGREWIFYLRKKVFYHDGKELTAVDVKYTLEKIAGTKSSWLVDNIQSIKVQNRYCLSILLYKPNKMFPAFLCYPQTSIVSQLALEPTDRLPVGTGPYKVTKFTTGICILETFDYYFGYHAFVDRIEIYNLSLLDREKDLLNDESELLFIETGECKIKNIPNWEQTREICGTTVLTLNQRKKSCLTDPNFRKAMYHLINREKMVSELANLRIYPSSGFQINDRLNNYNHETNQNIGLQMLNKSNYKGEPIKLCTYPRHSDDAFWIRDHLKAYGINIKVQIYQWGEMLDQKVIHDADMILFEAIISEGVIRLIEYYKSDHSFIKLHLDTEKLEQTLSKLESLFAETSDQQEILSVLNTIEKQLLADHSIIFLNYMMFSTYHHPSLRSLTSNFKGWIDYKDIWFRR